MQIRPSTMVMSVACAASFGLAIHAELEDRHRFDGPTATVPEAVQPHELLTAEQLELDSATIHNMWLDELFGSKPASLGIAFHDLRLDAPKGSMLPDPMVIDELARTAHLHIQYEPDSMRSKVHIGASNRELCAAIVDRLAVQWHEPITIDGARVWIDPATSQRAVLVTDGSLCSVDVTKYAFADDWFDRSRDSIVPIWAIGEPVERLETKLDGRFASKTADSLAWDAPGLGTGVGSTHLVATLDQDLVVAVEARTVTSATTNDELVGQLTKILGKPAREGNRWKWSSTPPVTCDVVRSDKDAARVTVRVGRTTTPGGLP